MGGGGSIVRAFGLLAITIVGSLLGICAANSAPKVMQASVLQSSGQVWSFQTPFGIIYGTIPREVVDYPAAHSAGTIVVSTSQRRLYYVLGGGKAIRYGIAVGMEGYAWSGVSTVAAKREWPDWTPTPDELRRMPYLPRHMAGGRIIRSVRARSISATRYTASMGPTSPGSLAAACLQAAFVCPTMTSSICIIVPRLARR
jgi:L,D-transpeptidase-like protein